MIEPKLVNLVDFKNKSTLLIPLMKSLENLQIIKVSSNIKNYVESDLFCFSELFWIFCELYNLVTEFEINLNICVINNKNEARWTWRHENLPKY